MALRVFELGWLERLPRTRGLRLNQPGKRGLYDHFALRLDDP